MKNIKQEDGRLTGTGIYLRPITLEDTQDIIRWRNSDVVRPFFLYQKPFTEEGHKKWLKEEIDTGKGYQFIACRREDDRPIGSAYLRDIEPECRKAEYGMFIGEPQEKGKGVGREMVQLVLDFGFTQLKLHKIFCRILADNMPSRKACINGGFREEAYLKDEEYVNGEYRDMVLLGAINPDEQ
jgi:RimJ/RimL family protein N-acetyltransferase